MFGRSDVRYFLAVRRGLDRVNRVVLQASHAYMDKNDARLRRNFLTKKVRILMEKVTAMARESIISREAGCAKDQAIAAHHA